MGTNGMKTKAAYVLAVLLSGIGTVGCGDNLADPSSGSILGAPQSLRALSASGSSIRLKWGPPATPDSLLKGYFVTWGSGQDSVPKTSTGYLATGLQIGASVFTIFSVGTNGQRSDGVAISWAPADRFDSAFVLHEYDVSDLNRASGMVTGSQSIRPSAVAMDPGLSPSPDFFISGPAGQPLLLQSAGLFVANFNITLFSPTVDTSPSLDFYLATFPTSFSEDRILVQDNAIYYARLSGPGGAVNYARIHLRLLAGGFPNRAVEVRLSLQRRAGLLYAAAATGKRTPLYGLISYRF